MNSSGLNVYNSFGTSMEQFQHFQFEWIRMFISHFPAFSNQNFTANHVTWWICHLNSSEISESLWFEFGFLSFIWLWHLFYFSKVTLTLVEPILESNNRVHLISDLWGRTYIRRLDIYPVHIKLWRHHFRVELKLELILSPIWIWRVLIFYPVWFYCCYNLPIF